MHPRKLSKKRIPGTHTQKKRWWMAVGWLEDDESFYSHAMTEIPWFMVHIRQSEEICLCHYFVWIHQGAKKEREKSRLTGRGVAS